MALHVDVVGTHRPTVASKVRAGREDLEGWARANLRLTGDGLEALVAFLSSPEAAIPLSVESCSAEGPSEAGD